MNDNSLEKFQSLLRSVFQFDYADLDFGIYRILNYKRKQIEEFITERLPKTVEEAFGRYAETERKDAEREVERLRQEGKKSLGEDAFDKEGQLKFIFRETPLGREYLQATERVKSVQVAEELKSRVYNDLFTFFSRYYEEGDFVTKRRYGRNETYAIPYNGEEVVLHWANRDQYYIKTGENFKTYRFKVGDYTVAFQLRDVSTEQNNQNKNRYFTLVEKESIDWHAESKAITIFLEYRPLTEAEEKEHGKTEQQRPQDKLNELAEKRILELVEDANLKVALAKNEKRNNTEKSVLRWRLDHFTRRNTTDFFIHKDLRGFLRRELDFFIKNEVLQLDELVVGKETDLQRHVQRGRVVKDIAEGIIAFLAQVEDFQKKLFEKKKFVVRTDYCLTIDRVPEEFWDEILANNAQIAEWRKLYSLDELPKSTSSKKAKSNFLKAHSTLMIDTHYFSDDFKWRLLAQFDDLDKAIDGILIKGENWQTLSLLDEKYRQKVQCIYLDPPYNTSEGTFLYKNNYKHSSWVSMIADRIQVGKSLLTSDGVMQIAIDDTEASNLRMVMDEVFGPSNYVCTLAIEVNPAGQNIRPNVPARSHDYCHIYAKNGIEVRVRVRELSEEEQTVYSENDDMGPFLWDNLRRRGGNSRPSDRPKQWFPLYADINTGKVSVDPFDGGQEFWPIDPKGEQRIWRVNREGAVREIDSGEIGIIEKAGRIEIVMKSRMPEGKKPKTLWKESSHSATTHGTKLLAEILGFTLFTYPKSLYLVQDCVRYWTKEDAFVLDYFAGSGTTAHAVINLNKGKNSNRKYILVEIGDWFETVMLPRIKKVVFCEKWKNGKPSGGLGLSHLMKYHILEEYEDTLNNIEFPREDEGQQMMELFGDEYLLRYMLDFETQGSPSLLNLDKLKEPFSYKLRIQEGDEIHERTLDLVETFNYLLGLNVKRMMAFQDNGRFYRAVLGEKNGNRIVTIWRPVTGLEDNEEALMRDKSYIQQTILTTLLGEAKPDRLLINGISFVEEAEAIEPEFKHLMFGGVA